MNDTITRLMDLADDYAAMHSNWVSGNTSQTTPHLVEAARQALQDELQKLLGDSKANSVLFTPLSDEPNPHKGDWLDTTRPKYFDN